MTISYIVVRHARDVPHANRQPGHRAILHSPTIVTRSRSVSIHDDGARVGHGVSCARVIRYPPISSSAPEAPARTPVASRRGRSARCLPAAVIVTLSNTRLRGTRPAATWRARARPRVITRNPSGTIVASRPTDTCGHAYASFHTHSDGDRFPSKRRVTAGHVGRLVADALS